MQIGDRIKDQRERLGISPTDLAKSAGVTLSALLQIEKGTTKNPRPETLLGIARRLGLSMEQLVDPSVTPELEAMAFLSSQAIALARWFDTLSEKQKRKAFATLLMSIDAAPDEYVQRFLPPAPKEPTKPARTVKK